MPLRLSGFRHVSSLQRSHLRARGRRARFAARWYIGDLRMPDSLSPAGFWGEPLRRPPLDERFLPPPDFTWGSFTAADGTILRWGHLPVRDARIDWMMGGGAGGGAARRPRRLPTRPRARKFDQDARDLADFAAAKLRGARPRLLLAHSMGAAIALVCLRRHPRLFDAAILSSPMVGLRTGKLPPTLLRVITRPARAAGLGVCFIPDRKST